MLPSTAAGVTRLPPDSRDAAGVTELPPDSRDAAGVGRLPPSTGGSHPDYGQCGALGPHPGDANRPA